MFSVCNKQIKKRSSENNKDPSLHRSVWVKRHKFFSHVKDWKKFETDIKSIVLFVSRKQKEIRQVYISKHNLKGPNQVILLMITSGENWHYIAVKSLSMLLLWGITLNHDGDYCCLDCLYLFRTKIELLSHMVCEQEARASWNIIKAIC